MPGQLTFRVTHRPGETPTGYLGRLAARNGVGTLRFAFDMGVDWTGLSTGRQRDLDRVAALAGMSVAPLRDAAFRNVEGWWWGDERVGQHQLRRTRTRICPKCVLEDVGPDRARSADVWQRAEWCFAPVLACPGHGIELVEVVGDAGPDGRHDFARTLATTFDAVAEMAAMARTRRPSALQDYLLARKTGASGSPWLDAMSFAGVAELARLLGRVALWGPRTFSRNVTSDEDLHAADDAGFVLVQDGEAGIVSLLEHHLRTFERPLATNNHRDVFPALLRTLNRGHVPSDHGWVRDIVGRYLVANVPLAPGEYLGQHLERRRLHTIGSAAVQAKMGGTLLRRVLVAEGVIRPDDASGTCEPAALDAERIDGLLNDLSTRLTAKQAASRLGLQPARFLDWVEAGLIRPFLTLGGIKDSYALFRSTDVDTLLERLTGGASPCTEAQDGLLGVSDACRRASCDLVTLVRLVLDRRLATVRRLSGLPGCRSLLVDPDEVRRSLVTPEQRGLSLPEVRGRWGLTWAMTYCLKDEGILEPLSDVSRHGIELDHYDVRKVEAFLEDHVTLGALAKERGTAKWWLRRRIDEAGIEPVFASSTRSVTIYRRTDLETLARPVQRGLPAIGAPPLRGPSLPPAGPGTPATHPHRVVADGHRSRDHDPDCHGPAGRR